MRWSFSCFRTVPTDSLPSQRNQLRSSSIQLRRSCAVAPVLRRRNHVHHAMNRESVSRIARPALSRTMYRGFRCLAGVFMLFRFPCPRGGRIVSRSRQATGPVTKVESASLSRSPGVPQIGGLRLQSQTAQLQARTFHQQFHRSPLFPLVVIIGTRVPILNPIIP